MEKTIAPLCTYTKLLSIILNLQISFTPLTYVRHEDGGFRHVYCFRRMEKQIEEEKIVEDIVHEVVGEK